MAQEWEKATDILGLSRIPETEELVESPLDALGPLLLALGGILVRKSQGVDVGPIRQEVEVQQAQVRQEDR